MRYVAALLVTLVGLASCSSSRESTAVLVPASSTSASTTTSSSVSSSTVPPDTTETTVPTLSLEPTNVVDVPAGFVPIAVAVGPDTVAILAPGSPSLAPLLWSTAMDGAIPITDLLPDALLMSNGSWWGTAAVAYSDGRYFAFISGDGAADDVVPTGLVSSDGATWTPLAMTVQVQTALTRNRTPESPPYEGASSVLDVAVFDGRIIATGWATVGDGIQPVVWESSDGDVWRLTVIGSGNICPEYGSQVAATQDLTVIELQGCTYYGAGVQLSVGGGSFTFVADYLDQEALSNTRMLGIANGNLIAVRTETVAGVPTTLRELTGGSVWVDRALPDTGENDVPWSGLANDTIGVVVWVTSLDGAPTFFWQMQAEGWLSLPVDGSTIIAVDDDHLVTLDGDRLLFYAL